LAVQRNHPLAIAAACTRGSAKLSEQFRAFVLAWAFERELNRDTLKSIIREFYFFHALGDCCAYSRERPIRAPKLNTRRTRVVSELERRNLETASHVPSNEIQQSRIH